jgi:uncharacterized protein (DUF2141 family)
MKYPKRIIYVNLTAIIIAFVMASCAKVGSPTGGPRDSIPPNLVNIYPPLETTNFQEEEIELVFDEFIQARTLKKDVIVNPPIEDYDFKVNKRTLSITINDPLRDSTTYTINFREAIKDATEGNIAENVVIAFSTGPTIDSFAVQGNVKQLMTQLPVEDITVGLYNIQDTLDIFNGPPMYLTRTDEEGNYEIKYVKEGTYRIYAFKDVNNNLKAESDKEPYGFRARPINFGKYEGTLSDTITTIFQNIDLSIDGLDIRPIEILSSRTNGKYYEIRFNKYITQYEIGLEEQIESLPLSDSISADLNYYEPGSVYSNLLDEHRLLRIYPTIEQDSVLAIITVADSIEQISTDTLYLKFEETQRKSEPFTETIKNNPTRDNYSIGATLTFNKPVIAVNMDSIILQYDTLIDIPLIPAQNFVWNKNRDELIISKKINKDSLEYQLNEKYHILDSINAREKINYEQKLLDSLKNENTLENKLRMAEALNKSQNDPVKRKVLDSLATLENEVNQLTLLTNLYDTATVGTKIVINKRDIEINKGFQLNIGKAAFVSIELDSSKNLKQTFSYKNAEEVGTIKGTITTEEKSFTIQLLNEKYEIVREIHNQASYIFDFIEPGTYYIRGLIDTNGNGKWDKGNILELEEPEPIFFYEEEIPLRENWEVSGKDISF